MIQALLESEVQDFIAENIKKDPTRLLLQKRGPSAVLEGRLTMQLVVLQIIGRQKIKKKIPSWAAYSTLLFPSKLAIEQCSSEACARVKISHVSDILLKQEMNGNTNLLGTSFIDLTGGFGVDTFFIGQAFENRIYIEPDKAIFNTVKENFKTLNFKCEQHQTDAASFLKKSSQQFDLVYLDPFRRDENHKKVFKISDCSPNLIDLLPLLEHRTKYVMVKLSPIIDINYLLSTLSQLVKIIITTVQYECKEVLLLLDFTKKNHDTLPEPSIICNHISASKYLSHSAAKIDTNSYLDSFLTDAKIHETFKFKMSHEMKISKTIAAPDKYLFEPHAGVMKGGGFATICERFNVASLHTSTHLYTKHRLVPDFPGKAWEILHYLPYSKKTFQKIAKQENIKQINVLTRNFIDSPSTIIQKLKLKPGGILQLIAFRNQDNKPYLAIGRRV